MDRNIYETNILPKGYKTKDITDRFGLSPKGLKLNSKDKQGLAYLDPEGSMVRCGILRDLLIKIRTQTYAIYTIISIDRIYKELEYIQLQNIK